MIWVALHFNTSGYHKIVTVYEQAIIAMNVIFIIADDLRTELSLYGRSHIISSNIDRLGSQCTTFDRAYTQVPVCFPSRHSILTGLRPDTLEIHTVRTCSDIILRH